MKEIIFHPLARKTIQDFPKPITRELGKVLWDIQSGEKIGMPVVKPMPGISKGVEEIRLKDESGAYRVFFFARSAHGILVFHAFKKKTQKTPKQEIELARKRFSEVLIG